MGGVYQSYHRTRYKTAIFAYTPLGMVRKDRTFIDAIKSYYGSEIKDTEKHDTEVEHMYYIEKLRHLLVMERDSKRFKVYNAKTGKWI